MESAEAAEESESQKMWNKKYYSFGVFRKEYLAQKESKFKLKKIWSQSISFKIVQAEPKSICWQNENWDEILIALI